MPDPVIRRLSCEATLYIEATADGLSLCRVVVDVPLPDPSVIVANLPARFHSDTSDAWEGDTPQARADAAEALRSFPRVVKTMDLRREAS